MTLRNSHPGKIKPTGKAVVVAAKFFKWFLLIFLLCFAVLPFLWLVMISFKTHGEFLKDPLSLPAVWQFKNYIYAFNEAQMGLLLVNSVAIACLATVLNIAVTSLGAFVLAREKFPLSSILTNTVLMAVLIPIIAFMVPYLRMIRGIGIYNTRFALILTYAAVNIPISFFIIESFMREIPHALDEAAVIEGAGVAQRFFHIIFPLSSSGIVTAGTLCFIYAWNEFSYAMLLTSSTEVRTVQLAIKFFTSQFRSDFPAMYAAIVISIVPSVALYIFFHNKIIGGFTAGAIKG